jgi:serpin B
MTLVWAVLIYWSSVFVTGLAGRFGISRRLKIGIAYSLALLVAFILASAFVGAGRGTPTPFTASPEVKSAVEGNTAFAVDLYQKLKERPGNLFFSPYSISTSLGLLYAGARGQTEREIANVLHINLPQTNFHAASGNLAARMEKVQRWRRITLLTANSLWCQQDYLFTDTFLDLARESYRAEARLVNFKESPQRVSRDINTWIGRKTKGKIKDMASPEQLTADTRLILCNAVYFKGKWASQFKPANTKPAPFFTTTNQTVMVPMMYQSEEFKMAIIDEPAVALLESPYFGRDLSMIILLPDAVDGLPELEQNLTADNLRVWLTKLDQASPHKTSVHLPRFTTTQSLELARELKSMGMPTAFNVQAADFSGIDGTNYLYIADAIHKAFVEVNESGAEAAAATIVRFVAKSMPGRFAADHPFIYLIRENGSGSILFLGRMVDPTKP